jgi:copper(I)-binding protein
MFRLLSSGAAVALIMCCAGFSAVRRADAQEVVVGSIHIDHPVSRATPKGATTAVGYMTITNKGSAPDRLVGGSASFAKALQIHTMSMDNNVMKMRELKDGIVIAPGQTVELKPQSAHLMFVGITHPLVVDTSLKGTLTFEKAGSVDVDFSVEPFGGRPGAAMSGGNMSGGSMSGGAMSGGSMSPGSSMAPHQDGMQH